MIPTGQKNFFWKKGDQKTPRCRSKTTKTADPSTIYEVCDRHRGTKRWQWSQTLPPVQKNFRPQAVVSLTAKNVTKTA